MRGQDRKVCLELQNVTVSTGRALPANDLSSRSWRRDLQCGRVSGLDREELCEVNGKAPFPHHPAVLPARKGYHFHLCEERISLGIGYARGPVPGCMVGK